MSFPDHKLVGMAILPHPLEIHQNSKIQMFSELGRGRGRHSETIPLPSLHAGPLDQQQSSKNMH